MPLPQAWPSIPSPCLPSFVEDRPQSVGDSDKIKVTIACYTDCVPTWPRFDVLVAIDVLRGTTTAQTAFERGARVVPAATLTEAYDLAQYSTFKSHLAGEIEGTRPPGFDFQNSPVAMEENLLNETVILLATAGTRLMLACAQLAPTLIASLRNVSATADHLARLGQDALILGADRSGQLRVEDEIAATLIAERLVVRYGWEASDEATELAIYARRPLRSVLYGKSGKFLVASGQKADIDFVMSHVDDLPYAYVMHGGEVRRA